MDELILILKEMGAVSIDFIEEHNDDDKLQFRYRDQIIIISGQWRTDSTGGLRVEVRPCTLSECTPSK